MSDINNQNNNQAARVQPQKVINPILTPKAPEVPVEKEEEVKADDFTSYEDEIAKAQPPIKPIHEEGEVVEDIDERQSADNLDDLVNASMSQVDDGEVTVKNLADAGFSIPVSKPEAISQYAQRYVDENADKIAELSRDMASDLQKIYAASIMQTEALGTMLEGMERMKKDGVEPKDQRRGGRPV